ncbi:UNVERIFIED_CONTAM: cell wall-binding repeat-containing protein, partial [Bacteroidetes bacterium 56_B9]
GAEVQVLAVPDPRATADSMRTVTDQDTLALGRQWGDTENFQARAALADNGELPGGGGLAFPGRRMVALYGHPYGPDLGVMGEQDPAAAVE